MKWNLRALLALSFVAAAAACENPVGAAHEQVGGVVLRTGAQDLVTVTGLGTTGGVTLQAGQQTAEVTVQFLDEDGEPITRSGYYLVVESSNPAVVTWQATAEGAFTGRIRAHAAGAAQLRLEYWHGRVGSGHMDKRFGVDVAVTAAP